MHLFSESFVVSHQVHGNNISKHKRKKESVILPQDLISHRVITSSECGKCPKQDSRFITAVQDVGASVGLDVKQQSPQRHSKKRLPP